jgi:hypothetical protein
MEKPSSKKRLRNLLLVLASVFAAATVWIVWEQIRWEPSIMELTASEFYASRPSDDESSHIEANADVALPLSAHDVYFYTTGFREIFTKLRFSMSAAELDDFSNSTQCQEPPRWMEPGPESGSDGTSEWWTPQQASYLKGCTGNKEHSHQTIMVDVTDARVYVVFVATSTY